MKGMSHCESDLGEILKGEAISFFCWTGPTQVNVVTKRVGSAKESKLLRIENVPPGNDSRPHKIDHLLWILSNCRQVFLPPFKVEVKVQGRGFVIVADASMILIYAHGWSSDLKRCSTKDWSEETLYKAGTQRNISCLATWSKYSALHCVVTQMYKYTET